MVESRMAPGVPHRLLLATDLSARCDRALDRAAQLANEWGAELAVLNVLDPVASPDQALAWIGGASDELLLHAARQQLDRDVRGLPVPATLHIARGTDAAARIVATAAATGAGLIVTGVARNEVLGRFVLGSIVERLARSLPRPLLIVRNRAAAAYRRIVVASDFSEPSRHALLAAATLFPGRELILYHASEMVMDGMAKPAQPRTDFAAEQRECAAFLAGTPLPGNVDVQPVIESGPVETTLARYVRQHDVDLVAMGSHGRGGIMSLLLGNTAALLIDWLPCDTLLVREPRDG